MSIAVDVRMDRNVCTHESHFRGIERIFRTKRQNNFIFISDSIGDQKTISPEFEQQLEVFAFIEGTDRSVDVYNPSVDEIIVSKGYTYLKDN